MAPPGAAARPRSGLQAFLAELQRRRVPRAAVAYLVATFGVMQGVQVLIAAFELPNWILTTAVVLAFLGFPLNLLLAWFVDVVPAGSPPAAAGQGGWAPERRIVLRKPTWAAIGVMALVVAGLAVWRLWPRPAEVSSGPAQAKLSEVAVQQGPASAQRQATPRPQTMLIADFENRTGEPVFDGTLEPTLTLAMEGASFITSFSRATARRIADQLKVEGEGLGESRARLVAQREGVATVTSGVIERAGAGYRVSLRAVDAVTGQVVVEAAEQVAGKEAVLGAATKLAARARAALGDTVPEAVQLAAGETFGAASLEAAHDYAQGMTAQLEGRWEEAVGRYQAALAKDPAMGRAYAGLAVIENNRGRRAEAERWFKLAMSHVDRMSDREKFRSRGAYYLVVDRDADRAIEALTQLVKAYPADSAGLANLAVAYQLKRDFLRALEEGRKAIAVYPRNVAQRNNVGLFAMYAGDFEAAIQEQRAVLEANPGFVNGAIGLALAQAASGRRDDAVATWHRLRATGPAGASAAAEGLADLALAEGRLADARASLEPGIEADLAAKDPDAAARKLVMLAGIHLAIRQPAKAIAAANRARQASDGEYLRFGAARVLAAAGDERAARGVADELDARLSAEPRMYAAILRGELEVRHRRFPDAIAQLKGAVARVDAWVARAALGRAYLEASAFTEAHAQLERCALQRGEATDLFLDVVPTWRAYPAVLFDLARALEGLRSPAAPEAWRAFLASKRGDEEPQVVEARRRLGGT
jgi:tetratricopeptide (TPR) repeat protein/TolB-like protein